MSKYIAVIPRAAITRAALVEAGGRSMEQVKAACGCQYILNSWFYDTITGRPVGNLKIDGTVKAAAGWNGWGLTWDKGADIRLDILPDNGGASYLSGVELLTPTRGPGKALSYSPEYGDTRGRSAVLLAGARVILYCSGDGTADAKTPEGLRDELAGLGWASAVMLDGGGSSQCDFGGERITASRKVHNWICVWLKQGGQKPPEQEDKPMSKHTVCLDPGHGPGNVNGSPDGTYKEWEFTWDMAQRIKPLLEAQGVGVVLTKTADNYPSLTERANISNKSKPDCFVSIHTNAYGEGGWSSASGLEIYTSAGPMTAQRNVLASELVNTFHAAGVSLRNEPIKHEMYTVLAKTDAPAALIEYGFHTNKMDTEYLKDSKYRDKLAEATAKGICEFLGVAWQAEPGEDNAEDTPDSWAAEAWGKAKDKGVLDGTRPRDNMTRQELAVVLDRLNLI
ncbi:N-acetylmuramoyl-L-alanine amidase [Flavonifractor plautii]|jgi:N-acetylmuramoyl-L-alanine amidase|nr:N-acetylmuramoyl-L-alanine amidase [Flavonifractor plautii]MDS9669021.1 N-acetylmuramoyl-L-alanine amidase [Flavonifractor plautii]